jgi:AcrR family transcriptional regulator
MTTTPVSTRRQQTRDRLMSAAAELFAERSVQAASVEEICERAGFTRGAFYSNFESKDELCMALLEARGEQFLESTRRALAAIPDAALEEHSLAEVIAMSIAVFEASLALDSQWALVRNELRLYAYRNPQLRASLAVAEQKVLALAVEGIAHALERQNARSLIPVDQLMVVLDAYYDRARMNEVLSGRPDTDTAWRDGIEGLLRALVVLPEPADAAV